MQDRLATFPRELLATLPTPLEHLPRLSEVAGTELWAKRDDLTGLALGGNKVRKLEFLLGAAKAEGCDTVVTASSVERGIDRALADVGPDDAILITGSLYVVGAARPHVARVLP